MTSKKLKRIKKQAKRRKRFTHTYSVFGSRIAPRVVLLVLGVLVVGQVILSSHLATQGAQINKLNRELEDLKKDNEQLSLQISSLGSLARIKEEASTELGMGSGKGSIDYLKPAAKLASR